MNLRTIFYILFFLPIYLISQNNTTIQFIENKGQFNKNVDYKLGIKNGDIFFNKNKITFNLYNKNKLSELKHSKDNNSSNLIEAHAYSVEFYNSSTKKILALDTSLNYNNYFLGNDKSKWANKVKIFQKIYYDEVFDNIDLSYYEHFGKLKYDFIVHPNANVDDIILKYNGVKKLKIIKGHLHVFTSVGNVIEQSPYAYQIINKKKVKVSCKYVLKNNKLSFKFPKGYNKNIDLVIDPILIFATYTGSTADNWGYTATYDNQGNMYVGGIAFASGYPISNGAYQIFYNGGSGLGYPGNDIAISKFSPDGSQLLYSTYFGGSENENPHSIVCNSNGELYIFGSTGSSNFPISPSSYDNSFNGGTPFSISVMSYPNGTDAFVSKFSANGTALLGSTYIGGSGNDAVNLSLSLSKNYADEFRGEIIIDANGDCLVASVTTSSNFPIIGGVQNLNNGSYDAVAFKLNSNLTSLLWSTYFGGTGDDAAYSIQLNSSNQPIITGGTTSSDLYTSNSALLTNYQGSVDGFVVKYNTNASNILSSSYIGTSAYDQSYFVQIDLADNVYLYGQTEGNYPINPATVYNNPGSGQFLHKLDNNLTTTSFSTVFGSGAGINISPSAFMVSDCDLIYVSGWGGSTNYQGYTFNMPITANAFQSNTDGDDFYLGVFNADANGLLYATYFGGNISPEHVDGGTSRFDKNGKVYQAVCAGCGGNSDFPTTTGVWSNTNNSTNCNLGAFKFSLDNITPVISVPQAYVCIPNSYQFSNLSQGGNTYFWDFGDGNTSNLFAPNHIYQDTGHYTITLIVSDSMGCLLSDTAFVDIDVFNINDAIIQPIDTLCLGDSVQLLASGGVSYQWSPSTFLSNPNIANPIASPIITTTYQVIVSDSCSTDTTDITVYVANSTTSVMNDTLICFGDIVTLYAYGGTNYSWYPTTGMINPGAQQPNVVPLDTTTYYVDITTSNGCIFTDSVTIFVVQSSPQPILPNDTTICSGDTISVSIAGVANASWNPINSLSNPDSVFTLAYPTSSTTYTITFTNVCAIVSANYTINVVGIASQISNDTIICPNDSALIWASNSDQYLWKPSSSLSNPDSSHTFAFPSIPTTYSVDLQNNSGCSVTLSVFVDILPLPYVNAGPDLFISFGEEVILQGNTNANSFAWYSSGYMSCTSCLNPSVSPSQTTSYILSVTDTNGCQNSDSVSIFINGVLYVPNTFTPNNDGINDVFEINGQEIKEFEIWIFNRWGELLYNTKNMNSFWDGTYKGNLVQIDTYVWKIKYEDYHKNYGNITGHVNVLK